jgi:DNA replication and repair protein RecF
LFKINHINLTQFRNAHSAAFSFENRITAICGLNGTGKTNLLDAIYYLCFTKSYFNKTDAGTVEKGSSGFGLHGSFTHSGGSLAVSLILRENGKKELSVDQEPITPFSSHIGKFPVVFIAPDDVILITGGSEERRKFIDTLLCQLDHDYLLQLIRYNKFLQDRNKYLKNVAGSFVDPILLDSFDEQLMQSGIFLLKKRIAFLEGFIQSVVDSFAFISTDKEKPGLIYMPSTSEADYHTAMLKARQKDILLQRTSVGVHRDDIDIVMNEMPFKHAASQGQKKSLLFAMKLAAFNALKLHFGFEPILLLDDIFEKLDQERLKRLLDWVCIRNNGQVILTDTHHERVNDALTDISLPFQLINL